MPSSVVPITFTLTYTAGANGTITGTTPQTVNHNADGTAVTAVPNTGCAFVNWSDSRTDNPRTDANVTTNLSVTANFALTPYGLWMQAIADPALRDPLADADGDGAPNLLEFAYGGDPITATSHVTAKTAIQSGDSSQPFTLTIPVRTGASFATTLAGPMLATVDGVTCRIEASSDLTTWAEPVAEVAPALTTGLPAAPAGYTYHTFRLTGSTAATPRAFIRFKALLP